MSAQRPRNPKAFTIVELLTVIAILAVLICMMAPVLVRGKELTRRTVCASNVKALSAAFLIYSTNNAGRIPLCCIDLGALGSGLCRQFDYLLMWNFNHYPNPDMAYGTLLKEMWKGYATESNKVFKGFYCPSQTAPLFRFDDWINPWLPTPSDPRFVQNTYTRVGYGTRPLAGWNPDNGTPGVSMGWPVPTELDLPRYQRLNPGTAIVADIVTDMEYTVTSHVDGPNFTTDPNPADFATPTGGVNFATAGGAVLWFNTANFNNNWQTWGHQTLTNLSNTSFNDYPWGVSNPQTGFYEQGTSPTTGTGVWFDMDKAGN